MLSGMFNGIGLRFSRVEDGKEVGRAFLYILRNDLHDAPFGLIEDVHVDTQWRGRGVGTALVRELIEAAKQYRCHKIIATSRLSRPEVHVWYESLGFTSYGKEFRLDLS